MHDSLQHSCELSADGPVTTTSDDFTEVSALERLGEVERLVGSALASWQDPEQVVQMRRFHRLPFQQPLLLTALDDRTDEPIGEPIRVHGRDISHGGLSIEHEGPLTCRKVAITLPEENGRSEMLVVRLTWCRFTRRGIYQSGGPIVRSTRCAASQPCDTVDAAST